MDHNTFQKLLERGEGPTLDFKATDYRLDTDVLKGNFIKDVLALLNTPRDEDAYVVMGVKRHADGRSDLLGIAGLKDDNNYQQVLQCIDPTPVIDFEVYEHEGNRYGLMRISRARRGPFCSTKDIGVVRKSVLYWRQGSMNVEAGSMANQRAIHHWATESVGEPGLQSAGETEDWQRLVANTEDFAKEAYYLLLFWETGEDDRLNLTGLGQAPWLSVIDFDTTSQNGGLFTHAAPKTQQRRVVHEVVIGDRPTIHPSNSTYWYFARGLEGRSASLVAGGIRDWKVKYPRDLRLFLDTIAAHTDDSPVHIVCSFPDGSADIAKPYFDSLLSLVTEAFGYRTTIHLCSGEPQSLETLSDHYNGHTYSLCPKDLARGIADRFAYTDGDAVDEFTLPGRSGANCRLEVRDRLWIEEEIEPLYLTSGHAATEASPVGFLNGGLPSWAHLSVHDDADRDLTPRILKQLRQDLGLTNTSSAGTVRVNVYHEPGVGGSTLARRLAWELHKEVPCAVIKRCVPIETVERVRALYNASSLPVLAIAEGSDITDSIAEDLYSHLKSQQIPVVLVRVLRSFKPPTESTRATGPTRAFYLPPSLSAIESHRFAALFGRAVPAKQRLLATIATGPENERHPFYFGLVAFEENFLGLKDFVRNRLQKATVLQKEIMIYTSLSYCYGQRGIPTQSFAVLLGVPPTRVLDLSRALSPDLLRLLRLDGSNWRPAHQIVGQEVLRQLLDPPQVDTHVWKQNLAEWANRFARFCRGQEAVPSAELTDIVFRCFLLRDARELIGREDARAFSRLLEDIPSVNAQGNLLVSLTELFPDEPHVWAHAGRFAFQRLQNPAQARIFIDQAIKLSPEDHVLYHIKGMAFRSECYLLVEEIRASNRLADATALERVVQAASEQFEEARKRAPDDEHGYISHVQMLLKVVDAIRTIEGGTHVNVLAAHPKFGPLVRRAIDQSSTLLEQLRTNRQGERLSEYTVSCTAQLDGLHGEYSAALQAWGNLLARNDVFKPPVRRQLVRTYLARHGRHWQKLSQAEIKRSVDLLQDNLLEEPNENQNLRLWVQAVRRLSPDPTVGRLLERVAYWRANSTAVDAAYYFYVLHAVEALAGSALSKQALEEALPECKRRARSMKNRNWSFEWLGPGKGARQLVHHSELGPWDEDADFWSGRSLLHRLQGRVSKIVGPEAGFVELSHGISAFFVPGRAAVVGNRDENRLVELYLGFTYDGLRAWEVKLVDPNRDRND
ncbi:MAG: ATP-binding protein [Deltaproteobacteria bacterium]|nr:ATP-binding protein [Deltaproteobacteria bacterium]